MISQFGWVGFVEGTLFPLPAKALTFNSFVCNSIEATVIYINFEFLLHISVIFIIFQENYFLYMGSSQSSCLSLPRKHSSFNDDSISTRCGSSSFDVLSTSTSHCDDFQARVRRSELCERIAGRVGRTSGRDNGREKLGKLYFLKIFRVYIFCSSIHFVVKEW